MNLLTTRDLMTARLVCKPWNSGACIRLRRTKTIKLRLKPELLEEYTRTMERSVDLPYSQYELEFYHMGDRIMEHFIHVCGRNITSLQLNNCRCTTRNLWGILNTIKSTLTNFSINCDPIQEDGTSSNTNTVHLPNLKSLSLFGEYCQNRKLIQDLIQSSSASSSSSALESLRFRCYDHTLTQESPFENLCFNIFCDSEKLSGESLLHFQMESRLTDSQVMSLTKKNCKGLKSLHINLDSSVRPESLGCLLETLSKTLVKLELDFEEEKGTELAAENENNNGESIPKKKKLNVQHGNGSGDEEGSGGEDDLPRHPNPHPNHKLYYTLPKMQVLRRLSLTNFEGSLAFLNHCDALKYLTLVNSNFSLRTLIQVDIHGNLTSFVSSTPLENNTCQILANVFPNLKILNVILDDNVLATVFQVMTNLEELIVSGDKVTDEGITGIENIFEMMTIYSSMDGMNGQLEEQIPELRKLPFIGNLGSKSV